MLGSGFLEFKLNYSETRYLAVGDVVDSDVISAGDHLWSISCYPRGDRIEDRGEYISIYLQLVSDSKDVKAICQVFLMGKDGEPCFSREGRFVHVYSSGGSGLGFSNFVKRSILEANYLTNDGQVTFICGIVVMGDNNIAVPPSEIGRQLGLLRDCDVGTDVSFVVKGKTIPAHRAVLAARSPVFKAELFGSMSDATSSSITLHDIDPATFDAMLEFMYTDELPEDDELGDSLTDMMQHLLAAADRYALDRLKLMCAQKLWAIISVDTFASTLVCAETHNCPELKSKCIDFFAVDTNFKKIVFTNGFMWLGQKFPELAATLKGRVTGIQQT